jgi:mycothiol synthase
VNSVGSVRWAHPSEADAKRVLALIQRSEIQEYGEPDSDLEDQQHDWAQMDLDRDAWIAIAPDGDLIGYGAVIPWITGLRIDFYTDPGLGEARELAGELVARCEARIRELAVAREQGELVVRHYVAHVNRRDAEITDAVGFKRESYHFQMQISLGSTPQEPSWPPGVELRVAILKQDERAIHDLIQSAFDRPGRSRQSFEEWKQFMVRPNIFDPDLWFLAEDGDEIVGACLCFEYPDVGWVRQLGVEELHRRKGLGSALLRHAFREFKNRGYERVGLVVESSNPDAYAFYQQLGMRKIRQYDEYQKRYPPGSGSEVKKQQRGEI